MPEPVWLVSMSTDHGKLSREAAKRRKLYASLSVQNFQVEEYLGDGWQIDRNLKFKTRLRKQRNPDEIIENRVWLLFYLLGYPSISTGRTFKVRIDRKGADPLYKQIDVLAKDDETVIVAECKASERIRRKSLQKDIEEFSNLKGPIANAIKKHYGNDFKPKIVWLFVTSNIVWSDPDRQRAAGENIRIITERELRYYMQIADHLRSAARFQFLAEFLKDQRIPELEGTKVPAIRGKLGGRRFYCFVSTPKQMLKISFVNHRSLNDPDGAPTYQRLVSRTRLRQISKFIHAGGFFPTNILVNFTSSVRFEQIAKDEETNVAFGQLYLPCRYRSAWVIDGQHRLYGFAPLDDRALSQNIMVVAFEGLDKAQEANLFVTINHEQKSVPKTLLDDLEGELKWGSEVPTERIGAVGARLIGLLNIDMDEPLYGRVTQQGIPATEKTCLTVPALKDGIRRSGLIGRAILNRKEYEPGPLSGTNDYETLDRARAVLNAYFGLLAAARPNEWEAGRQGYLCTNVSIQAYLALLSVVISYMESNKGLSSRELSSQELVAEVEEYLDPILSWLEGATPAQMESEFKVQFGSGGPREYYYRLCRLIKSIFSDFAPEGFADWEQEQSTERVADADHKLKKLNIQVQKFIFDRLKDKYGVEKDAYWYKGVTDKKIMERAYAKSLDEEDDERLPLENYLDFIEYKMIVENKLHWHMYKPVFDIAELGEKGRAKNLRWMGRVNELRRIAAHPTESRLYRVQDFEYIEWVFGEFMSRLADYEGRQEAGFGEAIGSLPGTDSTEKSEQTT